MPAPEDPRGRHSPAASAASMRAQASASATLRARSVTVPGPPGGRGAALLENGSGTGLRPHHPVNNCKAVCPSFISSVQ